MKAYTKLVAIGLLSFVLLLFTTEVHAQKEVSVSVTQNFSNQACSPDNCYGFAVSGQKDRLKIGYNNYNGCGPWHADLDQQVNGNEEEQSIRQLGNPSIAGLSEAAASSVERGTTSMFYVAATYPLFRKGRDKYDNAPVKLDGWGGLGLLTIKDTDRDIALAREYNILVQKGSTYPVLHLGLAAKVKVADLYLTGQLAYSFAFTGDPTFEGAMLDGPTQLDVGGLSWAEWRVGIMIPVDW